MVVAKIVGSPAGVLNWMAANPSGALSVEKGTSFSVR
jgi:hypothetical protein